MAQYVERHLFEWLQGIAANIDAQADLVAKAAQQTAQATDKAAHLKKQLATLGTRMDRLTNKMLDGTIPEDSYERLRDELEQQRTETEQALRQASLVAARPPVSLIPDLLESWPILPLEAKRDILSRIIDYVEVTPGRPRAQFKVHPRW